jgi:ribonuclease III
MPSTTSSRDSADPEPTAPAGAGPAALVAAVARRAGHTFADPSLLELALRHRSWCAEHPGQESNERLELLGDAVLGMVVTDHVFHRFPAASEGELAKIRATVVSAVTLAEVADELHLGEAVLLGKGEDASGGREKPSILADAMEAVIGAVYLDGGPAPAAGLVLGLLGDRIAAAAEGPGGTDYKTQLQELAARRFEQLPVYDLEAEGPDHQRRFFAVVRLDGRTWGAGEGRSKKQAEQAAARAAFDRLRSDGPGAETGEEAGSGEEAGGDGAPGTGSRPSVAAGGESDA